MSLKKFSFTLVRNPTTFYSFHSLALTIWGLNNPLYFLNNLELTKIFMHAIFIRKSDWESKSLVALWNNMSVCMYYICKTIYIYIIWFILFNPQKSKGWESWGIVLERTGFWESEDKWVDVGCEHASCMSLMLSTTICESHFPHLWNKDAGDAGINNP